MTLRNLPGSPTCNARLPRKPFSLLLVAILLVVGVTGGGAAERSRILTFGDRVRAQEAIERVYYAHQIGTTKPFEVAVPRDVIEAKVVRYLKLSVALEKFWNAPVTAAMLDGETRRLAQRTRMPERLNEIYEALGNDSVLFEECYARQVLVDRLAREYFASDKSIHMAAQEEAEALREQLVSGSVAPDAAHPRRSVVTLRHKSGDGLPSPEASRVDAQPNERTTPTLDLSPEEFRRYRTLAPAEDGVIGPVVDHRDRFTISIVLAESDERVEIATFDIPKVAWSDWWDGAGGQFDEAAARQVVANAFGLPLPTGHPTAFGSRQQVGAAKWDTAHHASGNALNCEGSWDSDWPPSPRTRHTAVWTGTEMIVWGGAGGGRFNSGGRYDPTTDTWSPTSSTNAPEGREAHTAVWTGTQMFVWGGYAVGRSINSGGRYDPTTDTWSPTSSTNAPEGRAGHTAIWTGTEMIVWGGGGVSGAINSGGRYDPTADAWTPTSTMNAPEGRSSHTAVWTGTEMIVWGGWGSGDFNSGGRYYPTTNTWSPTSITNAPEGRAVHTAVWTGTEMIVWGGFGTYFLNSGGRYDPTTDTWGPTSTTSAPERRAGHTAVWTGTEMIVWGGYVADGGDGYPNTGGRYYPTTDTWSPMSRTNAPTGREFHTAVWTGTQIIVWGGDGAGGYLNSGGRYDPTTDTWSPTSITDGPTSRSDHTAVWTGTQMIVWGGFNNRVKGSGSRYDPTTDTWSPTSSTNAPKGRSKHTAVWTGTQMIIWGGLGDGGPVPNSGGRYDPTTDTWGSTSTTSAPERRAGHTAVWTGTQMIVWGGYGAGPSNSGGRYDPTTDTWAPISTTNAPGSGTAVWTGTVMIVWSGGGATNSGGRYDTTTDTWSPTSSTNAPEGRYDHTAIWTGTQMIIWGGLNNRVQGSGGRYDPTTDTWSPTSSTNAPEGRSEHSAVWTGTQMIVWGGNGYSDNLNSGGRYDPTTDTWFPTSITYAPEGRSEHSAVWTGTQMIVWGGRGASQYFNSGGQYTPGQIADNDGDGFTNCAGDCDDTNPSIHPGAVEICDGLDDDCDGTVPDTERDADHDGYTSCALPLGDCDDTNPLVHPGAVDLPGNALDEDCSGVVTCDPAFSWRNHGDFVRCVSGECSRLVGAEVVPRTECSALVSQAAQSSVGRP